MRCMANHNAAIAVTLDELTRSPRDEALFERLINQIHQSQSSEDIASAIPQLVAIARALRPIGTAEYLHLIGLLMLDEGRWLENGALSVDSIDWTRNACHNLLQCFQPWALLRTRAAIEFGPDGVAEIVHQLADGEAEASCPKCF